MYFIIRIGYSYCYSLLAVPYSHYMVACPVQYLYLYWCWRYFKFQLAARRRASQLTVVSIRVLYLYVQLIHAYVLCYRYRKATVVTHSLCSAGIAHLYVVFIKTVQRIRYILIPGIVVLQLVLPVLKRRKVYVPRLYLEFKVPYILSLALTCVWYARKLYIACLIRRLYLCFDSIRTYVCHSVGIRDIYILIVIPALIFV